MRSRAFETRSFLNSLAATLAVLPSMSLFPKAPFDLSVCPSMSLAAGGSIVSRLAPAALDRYLAAAPAMSRFPTAPFTRRDPRGLTLITRTARCLRQLPSCVAVYPRD